ncbi:hypothetical protein LTR66_017946 [Elasticomyces elasticus]|nr:hypothetical protein LTR66_017946 [Elasticomyces elasticus]
MTVIKGSTRYGTLGLYAYKIGTLKYEFDEVSLKELDKVKRGKLFSRTTYHSLDFELRVEPAARSGVLAFDVCYNGKVCGTANIDFEKGSVVEGRRQGHAPPSGPYSANHFSELTLVDRR